MAEDLDISKSLEQSLKSSKRLQGDTNDELNKSINFLSRINDLQESYLAKVKSLNKETLNTKTIQKEIEKANQKKELSLIKISNIEKSLGAQQKRDAIDYINRIELSKTLEEEIRKAKLQGNTTLERSLGRQLSQLDAEIDANERSLTINERQYAAAIQANKVAEESVSLLEEQLTAEKNIEKSVGFTGKALGALASKLGLGSEFFGEMVEKARDLDQVGKKLTFGNKLKSIFKVGKSAIKEGLTDPMIAIPGAIGLAVGAAKLLEKGLDMVGDAARSAGNFVAGMSKDSSNLVRGLTSGVSSLVKNIPIVGGLLSGLIDGFSAILDLVIGVDNYVVQSGRQLGLSADKARQLNIQFAKMSEASGDISMTSRDYMESQKELTKIIGLNNIASEESLRITQQLRELSGLDEETIGEVYKISKLRGVSEKRTLNELTGQVAAFQKVTGLSFNLQKVMKEASSLGGYLGLQFSKYPDKIMKAVLTTKALGLEIKKVDSIADSLLDFETSISKEFEAQLLTGRNINLQRARELALANDITGLSVELAEQIGSSADFMKMNRIEQQAWSEATSMTRDEIGQMLKDQDTMRALGKGNMKDAMEYVRQLRLAGNEQELLNKLKDQDLTQSLLNRSVQEDSVKIMEKLKQSIVDFIMETKLVDKIKEFIELIKNPDKIKGIIGQIKGAVATFTKFVSGLIADAVELIGAAGNLIKFGDEGDFFEANANKNAANIRKFGENAFSNIMGSFESKEMNDGVIFPQNKLVVNKDPLDYTIFTKDPQSLFQGGGIESSKIAIETMKSGFEEIKNAVVQAINSSNNKTTPVILNVNTTMDAYASMRQMKISYDGDIGSNIDQKTAPYNNMRTNMG